jgi:hypothetical protein
MKMKKVLLNISLKQFLLLVAVIYFTGNTYAQKPGKNYISMNYSFGLNSYSRNGTTVGGFGASYDYEGANFMSISVEYARRTKPGVEFCTGITATGAFLMTTSRHYSYAGGGPNTSNYKEGMLILSLPLHLRRHFMKYLFVEGGLNLNWHPSKGYKYGAGLSANIGAEYVFHSGITLSASPFVQWNLMMGADYEHDTGNAGSYFMSVPDKLLQTGIKLGVGYRF